MKLFTRTKSVFPHKTFHEKKYVWNGLFLLTVLLNPIMLGAQDTYTWNGGIPTFDAQCQLLEASINYVPETQIINYLGITDERFCEGLVSLSPDALSLVTKIYDFENSSSCQPYKDIVPFTGSKSMSGEYKVEGFHLLKGASLNLTSDLTILSRGDVVIDGDIFGTPAEDNADGQHLIVKSRGNIIIRGDIRLHNGGRATPTPVALTASAESPGALNSTLLGGAHLWKSAKGIVTRKLLDGGTGGSILLRANEIIIDGHLWPGDGGAGLRGGQGGNGGSITLVSHNTYNRHRLKGGNGGSYGGRGGHGGDVQSLLGSGTALLVHGRSSDMVGGDGGHGQHAGMYWVPGSHGTNATGPGAQTAGNGGSGTNGDPGGNGGDGTSTGNGNGFGGDGGSGGDNTSGNGGNGGNGGVGTGGDRTGGNGGYGLGGDGGLGGQATNGSGGNGGNGGHGGNGFGGVGNGGNGGTGRGGFGGDGGPGDVFGGNGGNGGHGTGGNGTNSGGTGDGRAGGAAGSGTTGSGNPGAPGTSTNGIQLPLPVELLFFQSRPSQGHAILEWRTASETNNRGFEVQHSTDGLQWVVLSFVEGHGTTTTAWDYEHVHRHPLPGPNYYRLRQMDFDGGFEYSKIISAVFPKNNEINIYPNPAGNFLSIKNIEAGRFKIFDATGRPVKEGVFPNSTINIADLKNGIYSVLIFSDRLISTKTIIKK